MKVLLSTVLVVLILIFTWGLYTTLGAGSFKRMVKISGVYSVYKPDGYNVVCFLDADSKSGGLSCLPISVIGEKK